MATNRSQYTQLAIAVGRIVDHPHYKGKRSAVLLALSELRDPQLVEEHWGLSRVEADRLAAALNGWLAEPGPEAVDSF